MSKTRPITKVAGFEFEGGVLTIRHGGIVKIDEAPNGSWTIQLGANTLTLTAAQVASLNTIQLGMGSTLDLSGAAADGAVFTVTGRGSVNISGVTITEAGPGTSFQADSNIAGITFDNAGGVTVNGSRTDYFATVWDELDDAYTSIAALSGGNTALFGGYGDTTQLATPIFGQTTVGAAALEVNQRFVQLGLEYVAYLESGGTALTFYTAKYAADGGDAGNLPDRYQPLHDNLLGNLNVASITGRHLPDPSDGTDWTAAEIGTYIPGDWEIRPVYSGSETAGAARAAVIAFDDAHDVVTPPSYEADYLFS